MADIIAPELLHTWHEYVRYVSYVSLAVGLGILSVYGLRLSFARDNKRRYDIISQHEIHYLWNSIIFLLTGSVLYISTLSSDVTWFTLFARVFILTFLTIGIGYGLQYALKFYYPFRIEVRLKKLRYKPRLSPDGRKMKLLSEAEEDVYLDEGMQAEEDVFSVDYDVWVDETSGYTKIEKYCGRLNMDRCPKCEYRTFFVTKEAITKPPLEEHSGILHKHFTCSYCGYHIKKEFTIAKLTKQKSKQAMV